MSGDRQDQRVGEGGQAIQAGNNVIIYQGVSAIEIAEILARQAQVVEQYSFRARETVDERLKEFEERILNRFAENKDADSEAFKEPAFQFAVHDAQKAFAKSGEPDVGETLVNILAQRSKTQERGIVALILDEAIEVSGKLSKPELSYLAAAFLVLRVKVQKHYASELLDALALALNPILEYIPPGASTASYLAGLGCMQTESIMNRAFNEPFIGNYGYVFNSGFKKEEFINAFGLLDDESSRLWGKLVRPLDKTNLIIDRSSYTASAPHYSTMKQNALYTFVGMSEADFKPVLEQHVDNPEIREKLLALARSRYWSEEEVYAKLESVMPHIGRLRTAFTDGGLAQGGLTAKGIAIAHSYLAHVTADHFTAPLSIWIN